MVEGSTTVLTVHKDAEPVLWQIKPFVQTRKLREECDSPSVLSSVTQKAGVVSYGMTSGEACTPLILTDFLLCWPLLYDGNKMQNSRVCLAHSS